MKLSPAILFTLAAWASVSSQVLLAQLPVDRDGDGHSDLWQVFHGIPGANGDDDSDGDGVSDRNEETAGTNPFSGQSWFSIKNTQHLLDPGGSQSIRLGWDAVAGKQYSFSSSADLAAGSWVGVGAPVTMAASGLTTQEFPLPTGASLGFFRGAVADVDNDRDGLSAFEEALIGTFDTTPNSGGTTGPADVDLAAAWADTHDPGKTTGPTQPNLREVEVAFIREAAGAAGGGADLVTAVGSGSWQQWTSWRTSAGPNPVVLATLPPLDGHHPKVALLTPAVNAAAPKFVTARIRPDGNLWLSCRSLAANGAFLHHKSIGYGSQAGLDVLEYAMAYRAFSTREDGVTHYHVVTAVVAEPSGGGSRSLRVVTWRVNATTGALIGLKDSGPLTGPSMASQPRLRIAHLGAGQFQLTYADGSSKEVHHPIWTDVDGNAGDGTGNATVLDIRGSNPYSVSRTDGSISGLTTSGIADAVRLADGTLKLHVWDRRPDRVVPGRFDSHLLTDNQIDLASAVPGLGLTPPTLQDSFAGGTQAGETLAQAVATGDFNGDGVDDAALGAPGRSFDGVTNAGGVYLLNGSFAGMENIEYRQLWTQNSTGMTGVAEDDDNFGGALAAGDFNGDGNDDLAVGIPMKTVAGKAGAGSVQIIYGTPFGLSADGNQLFTRDSLGQVSAAGDTFGQALVAGDFNDDGRQDLAIGSPGETVSGQPGAGAVYVLWGAAAGLSATGNLRLHQDSAGLADQAEDGDGFGRSLASGDFNGGGKADLAVGIPNEDVGAIADAGAVQVLYGNTSTGFSGSNFITRNGFDGGDDIQGTPTAGDTFGWSLATGDFNDDTADDLAIGAPFDSVAGPQTGALHVLNGTILGLTWINNQFIRQAGSLPAASSLPSSAASTEDLGWSLTSGDCNGDGITDLVVSAPGEDFPDKVDAGIIFVIKGSEDGLMPQSAVRIGQDTVRVEDGENQTAADTAAANDKFAFSLACGDFNADGEDDLIAGIPRKDNDTVLQCGAAHFIRGSATETVTLVGDFMWMVKTRELVRGLLSDLGREEFGGPGAGELFSHNEGLGPVHMASTTKCMTLLLAVEAIEDGKAALDDEVIVSNLAGTTGGSKLGTFDANGDEILDGNQQEIPFIQPGDKMPLRLLMAGMMNQSCNRSSVAIGQHIAMKVKGHPDQFINMMNARADLLGLTTSSFGHPAGGWVTQLQDGVTLMREGVKHPLFVQFSSLELYGDQQPLEVLIGADLNGVAKPNGPFVQFMSMGTYPGRIAWKGGNGGLWFADDQALNVPPRPPVAWCTESRTVTARRMDRTFAVVLQQTGGGTSAVQTVLDYGYRKLFTPDARSTREFPEPGGIVGPEGPVRVRNFAITAWDGHGATAIIDDHEELRLNIWSLNYAANLITPAGNAAKSYPLAVGSAYEEPALTRLTEIPTQDAIADFFSANLTGEHLDLTLWRVGEDP